MGALLLGAPLLSATAGSSAVGLLGAGGVFAPLSGSIATFAGSAAGLSALGTGLSALGTLQSSQAQAANAEFNSKLQEVNAKQSLINAEMSRRSAAQSAKDVRDETRRRVSSIRALQAKSGVVTSEGSPLLVQQEQFAEGAYEAQKQLYAGEVRAQGYESDSVVARMRAESLRSDAGSASTLGLITAGSQILTGGSKILG